MLIRYYRQGRTELPNAGIRCGKVTTLRSLEVEVVSSD